MDMKEFTAKLEEATKQLSDAERASLEKLFQSVSGDITKADDTQKESPLIAAEGTEVPDGITPRLNALKKQYLEAKPTISLIRAINLTKISKENEGLPKAVLRGTAFK
ncbi:formate C-acetyltransferase/glycerol dehydratase family glycyl radical enzyme, partial [Streptococcus iniae]